MREYGRVFSTFWSSQEIRDLSEDGRTLALYLLTCSHANLIGCFRLPTAYAADDLQWSSERVSEGLLELSSNGFVSVDSGSKWVVIHKFIKWNPFENGNVAKAAAKAFDQVPIGTLKCVLINALLEFGNHLEEPFRNRLETLSKPFRNPEPEPEPYPEPIPEPEPLPEPEPKTVAAGVENPTPPHPKKINGHAAKPKSEARTDPVWQAYSAAYIDRYGTEPVRNAKGNAALAALIDRLGIDEAPPVAAFYVWHNKAFYVSANHPLGVLLQDCEGLRTQWATGRQTTTTGALQADRTQTNHNAFAPLIAEAEARERANGKH